ncbi:MAG: energy transducer TonB [Candidatus Sulfotelmatobacter sp.]
MRKITLLGLWVCTAAWAQTGSAPVQGNDSHTTTTAQATPSSTVTPSNGQDITPSKPLEYKLEPAAVSNVVYPAQARDEKIEGEVVVSMRISRAGDVIIVRVLKGDPLLAQAVAEAAKRWKFKPVISGSKAIAVVAGASLRFALSDDNQRVNGIVPEIGPARQPDPVRVSEGVSSGLLVHKVKPVYSPEAKQAHVKGTVLLRVLIDEEGRVADLRLISGPKELAPAAVNAVQQWRYRPYLLMGNPVQVDTEVSVRF